MFIIDQARRLIGQIAVETIPATHKSHAIIRVSGIRGDLLAKDLQHYYKTTRVAKYMFDRIGSNFVTFPAFFALEVLEIMETIINTKRPHYVNRRTATLVRDALVEGTWLNDTVHDVWKARLDLSQLKLFKKQPLDFQRTWLDKFDEICYRYKLNGAILDSVMGSGKTMMGLYVAECSKTDNIIIFTPKNAIEKVWYKTITNDLNYTPTIWRSDSGMPYKGEKYILCHYEAMGGMFSIIEGLNKTNRTMSVVIDESHNFNEMSSQRTRTLIDITKATESEYIILQSGTTFKAIGAEVVPALYMIDPTFDEDLATRFRALYAASATEALELLKRRLGMITYKVVSEQVGLGKPIIETVKVKTPNSNYYTLETTAAAMAQFVKERNEFYNSTKHEDERIYKQILEEFEKAAVLSHKDRAAFNEYKADVALIRRGDLRVAKDAIVRSNAFERGIIIPNLSNQSAKEFKEIKTIYKYVTLKIQGECLGRILGARRMECSVEIANHFDYDKYVQSTDKKSLVYTIYVKALEAAVEKLKEIGYKPLAVYGETNYKLNSIITDFERNLDINPLCATFKSLSTAVPLTTADVMIMLDVPFRSYIMQQAIARIERLGTTTQTYVFIAELDTAGSPNLSSRTLDILKWSQAQIERITGVAPPFAIEEKAIGIESFAMIGKQISAEALVDTTLEEAFMAPYI